ncbi:MAG TPA: right-handed parallel beta-helix repeat-containing protein [Terriglobales bacterium]|nr:right-handed parallel beta-helix repeat-containing protein [Terriglobales bacterium]
MCKKTIYLLGVLLVLLWAVNVSADTIPGGDVFGTWYQSQSPYYIAGSVTIPANDTLTIEPGVDVIFLGYYYFDILGVLEAAGSVSDSVHFLPQDTLTGWQGLSFSGQKICHLYYCDIRYAYSSGIRLTTAKNVYISHCTVAHCRSNSGGGGIFVDLQANLRLSNSIIEHNTAEANIGGKGGGICVWNSDSTFIDSCTIRGNRTLIPIYTTNYPYDSLPEGGGIFTRKGIDVHAFITNCVITGNYAMHSNGGFAGLARGGGIYIGSTQTMISGCVIRDNVVKSDDPGYGGEMMDGSGIYLNSQGSGYNTQVSYCDISRNLATAIGALHVRTNNVTISNCTFFGNTAMYGPSGYAIFVNNSYGTGMDIVNCVIAYNASGISGQSTICRYSNIYQNSCWNMAGSFGMLDTVNYNGDSCDMYFNIFMDPMFVDTTNGDLHLLATSPCIDAGDPNSPKDPDSSIADMGALYYHYLRGDANQDEKVTVADIVYLVSYLFKHGPAPAPFQSGEANCDGKVTVADVVYLVAYLFKHGPQPAC